MSIIATDFMSIWPATEIGSSKNDMRELKCITKVSSVSEGSEMSISMHLQSIATKACTAANILQAPPFTKPELLFPDIHFNPFVIQVMNA